MLPQRVADLSAQRTANTVELHWTMPARTLDRLLLKGDQHVVLCRAIGSGACQAQGERLLLAGAPEQWTDTLPAAFGQGPPVLIRYELRLLNGARRDAGPSNPAYVAGGWAPPAVHSAEAATTPNGIAVAWSAAAGPLPLGGKLLVRLERTRVLAAGESARPDKGGTDTGVPQPASQVLELPAREQGAAWKPAVDADALLNRSYRYTVQLVDQVNMDGRVLEISGSPAETRVVNARDVFPPAVPADLAAVANGDSGTIDLSWTPDADPDTAGYFVYRRPAGTAELPPRVSGPASLAAPDWSDRSVRKGVRYLYSVSAVDASGNESARSPEVGEALPR